MSWVDVNADAYAAPRQPSCPTGDASVSRARRVDIIDLTGKVCALLDLSEPQSPPAHMSYRAAQGVLDQVAQQLLGAVASAAAAPDRCIDPSAHLQLMTEIKQIEHGLLIDALERRDAVFNRVRDAMEIVRDAESIDALMQPAVSAVCALGFDRAILSRVENATWLPELVYVDGDRGWARRILDVGSSNPLLLNRSLVDTEMVRRKASIVVYDVQERTEVNRPIAEVSKSRSYAAAPLIVRGEVVGFVHADLFYQQRDPHDLDRLVLSMYADGLSQILARATMADQLRSVGTGLVQLAQAASTAPSERVHVAAARGPLAPIPAQAEHTGPEMSDVNIGLPGEILTRREVQVLRLVAVGATNSRISRQLGVAEGTVKSHVKSILRKLGTQNRGQAAALWHQRETARKGRPEVR